MNPITRTLNVDNLLLLALQEDISLSLIHI